MPEILVVDDEEQVRRFVVRILRNDGFRVHEAVHGREAMSRLESSACAAGLVVSDIVMPEMNGVELLELLSIQRPKLPVILMTGYSPAQLTERGIAAPCALLTKPFMPEELLAEVHRCFDDRAA